MFCAAPWSEVDCCGIVVSPMTNDEPLLLAAPRDTVSSSTKDDDNSVENQNVLFVDNRLIACSRQTNKFWRAMRWWLCETANDRFTSMRCATLNRIR